MIYDKIWGMLLLPFSSCPVRVKQPTVLPSFSLQSTKQSAGIDIKHLRQQQLHQRGRRQAFVLSVLRPMSSQSNLPPELHSYSFIFEVKSSFVSTRLCPVSSFTVPDYQRWLADSGRAAESGALWSCIARQPLIVRKTSARPEGQVFHWWPECEVFLAANGKCKHSLVRELVEDWQHHLSFNWKRGQIPSGTGDCHSEILVVIIWGKKLERNLNLSETTIQYWWTGQWYCMASFEESH